MYFGEISRRPASSVSTFPPDGFLLHERNLYPRGTFSRTLRHTGAPTRLVSSSSRGVSDVAYCTPYMLFATPLRPHPRSRPPTFLRWSPPFIRFYFFSRQRYSRIWKRTHAHPRSYFGEISRRPASSVSTFPPDGFLVYERNLYLRGTSSRILRHTGAPTRLVSSSFRGVFDVAYCTPYMLFATPLCPHPRSRPPTFPRWSPPFIR